MARDIGDIGNDGGIRRPEERADSGPPAGASDPACCNGSGRDRLGAAGEMEMSGKVGASGPAGCEGSGWDGLNADEEIKGTGNKGAV